MRGGLPDGIRHAFSETAYGQIHSVEQGDGPALILLHSVGCSAFEFADVMAPLSERFRVIAWDMPGHGDSAPLSHRLQMQDYAKALLEGMDRLGVEKAHVSGASIGGLIALASIDLEPGRFSSLGLLETGFMSEPDWASRWGVVEGTFGIAVQALADIAPRFRAADEALLHRWNIDRSKAGPASMVAAMWALRTYRFEPALERVQTPNLLLFGDRSPVLSGLETAKPLLRNPEVVLMADCGHFPMVDDPPAFVSHLLSFLRTGG